MALFNIREMFLPIAFCSLSASPSSSQTPETYSLDQTTVAALESLQTSVEEPSLSTRFKASEFGNLIADSDSAELWTNNGIGNTVPAIIPDTLVVSLAAGLSEEEIGSMLDEYGWRILETYPSLGSMRVSADLSEFFVPTIETTDPNSALISGIIAVSGLTQGDNRIVGITPDFVVSSQQSRSGVPVVETFLADSLQATEVLDWGIADIEADQLWSKPASRSGSIFAVLDVGFAEHEDLVYLNGVGNPGRHDHGNHVAGIACAQHNSVGIAGVLPNCFVRASIGDFLPIEQDGGNVVTFMSTFGQIANSLDRILSDPDGARIVNISLGYNWIGNFGINVDDPTNSVYRSLVEATSQGLVVILLRASDRGLIVVSAAGNDSSNLPAPMHATFASPFNWSIDYIERNFNRRVGLVIEAHDENGDRAAFSNINGDLSCPGVSILSTLAFDQNGIESLEAYGTMSGTSMASPYCAAGLQLLWRLHPSLSSTQLIDCALSGAIPTSNGSAPQMRLARSDQLC